MPGLKFLICYPPLTCYISLMWRTLGFDREKEFFERAMKNGDVKHAYLFTGQDMIGKRTFALELVDKLVGAGTKNEATSQFDILFIDSSSSESGQTITIDAVKEIKNRLSMTAYSGGYKCCIINDAHRMTDEAQNALLKILEEPNEKVVIFLVASKPDLLKPTIKSRCEEIYFAPHGRKILDKLLSGEKLSENQKEFVAEFCGGRVGLLKNIIEKSSYKEIKTAIEELSRLEKADIGERFLEALKMLGEGDEKLLEKLLYWMLYLRSKMDNKKYAGVLERLQDLYVAISKPSTNKRFALENFLLHL
ncbi:MAG: DNA polymerase III subunit delta' [Parcubacteria group bacterium Licking1014_17]|nr:MAG: DNA polymerase III subunit delta' [Parcubacteria group bacterium Licking1014_17]